MGRTAENKQKGPGMLVTRQIKFRRVDGASNATLCSPVVAGRAPCKVHEILWQMHAEECHEWGIRYSS